MTGLKFREIDIKSNQTVTSKGYPAFIIVSSMKQIGCTENEIGILTGISRHHRKGIFFQGGRIATGWKGYLTLEFIIFGEATIGKGEIVAHAIIFSEE